MLAWTTSPGDRITPFFGKKKSGALRIAWDCWGVNTRFKPPPSMGLASGSRWADVAILDDVHSAVSHDGVTWLQGDDRVHINAMSVLHRPPGDRVNETLQDVPYTQ